MSDETGISLDAFEPLDDVKTAKVKGTTPREPCNTPTPEPFLGTYQDLITMLANRANTGDSEADGVLLNTPFYFVIAPVANKDEVYFKSHTGIPRTGANAGKQVTTVTEVSMSLPNERDLNPTNIPVMVVKGDRMFPAERVTPEGKVPALVLNAGLQISKTLKTQTVTDAPVKESAPVAETATA